MVTSGALTRSAAMFCIDPDISRGFYFSLKQLQSPTLKLVIFL